MEIEIKEVLFIIITTFLATALFMPIVKNIAAHINAVDKPDPRKVHTKPMPRLGGLGIFGGFLLGYVLFAEQNTQMISILIGGIIIVLTGIIDDIKPIKAKHKLVGQVMAALVIVFYGQITLSHIDALGLFVDFGWFQYPVTLLFIVGAINAINLIDGLDGLSGGISSIFFLTTGVLGLITNGGYLEITLAFIMFGSTLGFLVHNFYPATIFAGDTGSMFFGFIISVIALLGYKNVTFTSVFIPIFLLAIPIMDTTFAIIRRSIKGQPIHMPDKSHLHHQLLNKEIGHRNTVLIIYLFDSIFAAATIIYALGNQTAAAVLYVIIVLIVLWLILFTDIIFPKKKEK